MTASTWHAGLHIHVHVLYMQQHTHQLPERDVGQDVAVCSIYSCASPKDDAKPVKIVQSKHNLPHIEPGSPLSELAILFLMTGKYEMRFSRGCGQCIGLSHREGLKSYQVVEEHASCSKLEQVEQVVLILEGRLQRQRGGGGGGGGGRERGGEEREVREKERGGEGEGEGKREKVGRGGGRGKVRERGGRGRGGRREGGKERDKGEGAREGEGEGRKE